MVVYIELAVIENFLLDGVLLWLALKIARREIRKRKIILSALVGAGFAVVYPFLTLAPFLEVVLKIAVGALLVLLAGKLPKVKKGWGRYALSCIYFFLFTLFSAGFIFAIFGQTPPKWGVGLGFCLLIPIIFAIMRVIYARRRVESVLYDCKVVYKTRAVQVVGYYDSGNLASKNGLPVCFLSPEVGCEVLGLELWEDRGQVCDEVAISTLSGEKRLRVFLGEIHIKNVKKQAYFALSGNMLSREYKLLLHARIFDEEG